MPSVSKETEPILRLSKQVKERIEGCKVNFCGILYGITTKKGPVILELSGKEIASSNDDDDVVLELMMDVLPAGLDPIGVFVVQIDEGDQDDEDEERNYEKIQQLVQQLPEAFLETCDPVIITKKGSEVNEAKGYLHTSGLQRVDLSIIREDEIKEEIVTIRVRGTLTLACSQSEAEITKSFRHLIDKVTCPYGCFRLSNSDIFYVHNWQMAKGDLGTGWAGNSKDIFGKEEDRHECLVTNIDNPESKVLDDLWAHIRPEEDEEEDDGFGVGVPKKKNVVTKTEAMNFKLLLKMSGDAYTNRTLNCSPVLHHDKTPGKCVKLKLSIDALGMLPSDTKLIDVMDILKGSVQRQLQEMGRSVLSEFKMRGTISAPEVFHYKPALMGGGHFITIIYTKSESCGNFAGFRKHLHKMFMLPLDRPMFRRMTRYVFESDKPKSGPLMNPHIGLKPSGVEGGKVYLVDGNYDYHHYMQDGFNDDGWGCAYRSLQTLISWFRYQGYTGTDIPTHTQIQKCLVDIGDKEKNFIGSKHWIGSTEVGFVLETACGIQSKFLSVSSGEEMASKGRELAHHFEVHGTPVMIGGGVLAHTILGVDWNENTGDIKWLILDPHYTGVDWTKDGKPNISYIQSKGWCGWKGPNFWVKTAFYNMCMPIRPVQW